MEAKTLQNIVTKQIKRVKMVTEGKLTEQIK